MNISKIIEQLGYKPNEVKVYLAALAIGEATISEIATKAQIPRSSTQVALDDLHHNGLINFYARRRYRYWVAEPPEKLIQILKEKEETLSSAMNELETICHGRITRPVVKVFTGTNGIELIQEHIIQSKHHIATIVPWHEWVVLLGQETINDQNVSRVRHFLNMRIVTPRSKLAEALKSTDQQVLRHTRFLPEGLVVEAPIFIFGDSVAIISLNDRQPIGVVIDDASIAQTMLTLFEEFWNQSKD